MAHSRITGSEFDEDNGFAFVTKSSKFGEATGVAYCHPEDADVKNMFTGSYIAEHRADTKLKQLKATELAARSRGIDHLVKLVNDKLDRMVEAYGEDCVDSDEFLEIREFLERQQKVAKREAAIARSSYHWYKNGDKAFADALIEQKRKFRDEHPIKQTE